MSDFWPVIAPYTHAIVALAALFIAVCVWIVYREPLGFWWMDAGYGVPGFGKLARLSRDVSRSERTRWYNSEETLCADYRTYVQPMSEHAFFQNVEYLRKAGDTGRSPLSLVVLALLFLLLAAEALGFGFLLSVLMAQDGSANLHEIMTFSICAVLAGILAVVTHQAGHQLRRSGLIKQAETSWRSNKNGGALQSREINLASPQSIDDADPQAVQLINRVGQQKSYWAVYLAAFLIAGVAIFSTAMRIEHMNGALIQETLDGPSSSGNPYASGKPGLPAEATAPQADAEQRAAAELTASRKGESIAGFIVLGIVFVVTQAVGITLGHKYGFVGKESKAAYDGTHGLRTYEAYDRSFFPRKHRAQSRLVNLQRRMQARNTVNIEPSGSFGDYLHREAHAETSRRQPVGASAAPRQPDPPVTTRPTPAPAAPTAIDLPAALAPAPSLTKALTELDALPDREAKKHYTAGLSSELRTAVVAEMKARKERAALMNDLDDVF